MKYVIFIIILILKTYCEETPICQNDNPLSPNDCWRVDQTCCYLQSDTDSRCETVPTKTNKMTLTGITYRVYCDYKIDTAENMPCLKTGLPPDSYKDCLRQSTPESSCCYFSYGEDKKGCFFVGSSQYGETEWNNMTIKCSASYYSISILFLIILIIYMSSSLLFRY